MAQKIKKMEKMVTLRLMVKMVKWCISKW